MGIGESMAVVATCVSMATVCFVVHHSSSGTPHVTSQQSWRKAEGLSSWSVGVA